MTAPITNNHFKERIFALVKDHLNALKSDGVQATTLLTSSRPDPIIPPITPADTQLFPSSAVNTYIGYTSSWIDLGSDDPIVASISRQILNLEINYANFCGIRTLIIAGPQRDSNGKSGSKSIALYARGVQEALNVGKHLSFIVHMPMCREVADKPTETLSSLAASATGVDASQGQADIFTSWDSWHQIRTVCAYSLRLFVGSYTQLTAPDNLHKQC